MTKKIVEHPSTFRDATTLPSTLEGVRPDDPRRSWKGAPHEGVTKLRAYLALHLDPYGLYLTPLQDAQLRQVRADRFNGEAEYSRRVAGTMAIFGEVLAKTEFSAEDIRHRLQRCESLDELLIGLASLLNQVQQTAHLEWSELTKLSDMIVTDIEAQLQRPFLSPEQRLTLTEAASVPLETWRARLLDKEQRKTQNEAIREETRDELTAQITALETQVRELQARLGARSAIIDGPPPPPKNLPQPTANKTTRRRNRTGE